MSNCYFSGDIYSEQSSGFTNGWDSSNFTIKDCYVISNSITSPKSDIPYKKAVIFANEGNGISIENCYYSDNLQGMELKNSELSSSNLITITNAQVYTETEPPFEYENPSKKNNSIVFQVGIDAEESSRISVDTEFKLKNLFRLCDDFCLLLYYSDFHIEKYNSVITRIDEILADISARQVEYGASQNRLESALAEISIKYENLTSSYSTLKDADITKVSSEYIKQQILQQASATLLATANQAPAIALQLL